MSPGSDMPEIPEFNLDRSVAFAWAAFERRLTDHLTAMKNGDVLRLDCAFDDPPAALLIVPCVQFLVWDGDIMRCEVPSNEFLDPARSLSLVDEQRLTELGWNRPTHRGDIASAATEIAGVETDVVRSEVVGNGSTAFYIDRHRSWASSLAEMATAAFRDVWGVAHPSFLRGNGGDTPFTIREAEVLPTLDPSLAITPTDREHLHHLIGRTLAPVLGTVPERDSGGDIPIRVGTAVMFIGPLAGTLDLQIIAPLVHSISDRTRAAEMTADLNRKYPRIKFVTVDDRLAATVLVSGKPFVPRQLTDTVEMLSSFLDAVDPGLAQRLRGTPYFLQESVDATDRTRLRTHDLPTELTALFDLAARSPDAVDTATVAEVCDGSRDRILQVLQIGNEWVAQHRRDASAASARGDEVEAEAIDNIGDVWEVLVSRIRVALRLAAPSAGTSTTSPNPGTTGLFSNPGQPTLSDDPAP